jgi:hypothetical protein
MLSGMRCRAQAYHTDSETLAADLGTYETRWEAIKVCEQHASRPLAFDERWPGYWDAKAVLFYYRIFATRE